MCIENTVRMKNKEITAYKVLRRIGENQFRPLFACPASCDTRTYETGKRIQAIGSGFHAFFSVLGGAKFLARLLDIQKRQFDGYKGFFGYALDTASSEEHYNDIRKHDFVLAKVKFTGEIRSGELDEECWRVLGQDRGLSGEYMNILEIVIDPKKSHV